MTDTDERWRGPSKPPPGRVPTDDMVDAAVRGFQARRRRSALIAGAVATAVLAASGAGVAVGLHTTTSSGSAELNGTQPRPSASEPITPTAAPSPLPPFTVTNDVTLAYFRPGVGVVGISPACCGNQFSRASQLWLTTDMSHWRNVTPPGSDRGSSPAEHPWFENASFLDAQVGWVTTWDGGGNVGVTIYRTRDGGHSWTSIPGLNHSANAGATVRIQLVSPTVAYRELLEPTGPGMDLSVTTDAGVHWRSVYVGPSPGVTGPFVMPIVFQTITHGFAADGIPPGIPSLNSPGYLFRTTDGGQHWVRQHPPSPSAARQCTGADNARASCVFGAPTFVSSQTALVPFVVHEQATAEVAFNVTSDGGQTWTLQDFGSFPVPPTTSNSDGVTAVTYPLVSVLSLRNWWILVARDGGATTWRPSGAGLPLAVDIAQLPGSPISLQAVDSQRAWVLTSGQGGRALFFTADGGGSWHEFKPTA